MSNFFVCKNRVEIEGVDVGQFEGFTMSADWRTFGETATLLLPMYAIGASGTTSGKASARLRDPIKNALVKVGAEVSVYCRYNDMEKVRVFHGFIENVEQGFPTKLYLRDDTFRLKFGNVKDGWDGSADIPKIASDCIKVSNESFKKYRSENGFTRPVGDLKYSVAGENVEAILSPINFDNYAIGRSPFDVFQHLMSLLCCYGGAKNNSVFLGALVKDNKRPIVKLSTATNVIARDIANINGMFVNYDVQVSSVLADGKKFTAEAGEKTSGSEPYRAFCNLKTESGVKDFANRLRESLTGTRNKGSITTLLYPKLQLLDHVKYTDTIFEIEDKLYLVVQYQFTANGKGYFQKIEVTDTVFAL